MRDVTVDCDLCGERMPLQRSKEAMVRTGDNAYHVLDVCPKCLDGLLQEAESVNDANGYRKQQAALIHLPGDRVPARRAS